MEKGYLKRLIFWGVIWILVVAAAASGMYMYYNGYGESGKIRQKLLPIVNQFNNLDYILQLKNNNNIEVKAKIDQNKIVITYTTVGSESKFDFTYSKENDMEILTNKYNTSDSVSGEIISRGMIDAVYIVNAGEGSLFDTYQINDFTKTTIEQGVNIKTGNDIEIQINLNTNILENLQNVDINDNDLTDYILENDLINMTEDLTTKNRYDISKKAIKIIVINGAENYQIYAENTDSEINDNLYFSVMNIIKLLNNDVYKTIETNEDKLIANNKTSTYEVVINAEVDIENTFNEDSSILEVIINK